MNKIIYSLAYSLPFCIVYCLQRELGLQALTYDLVLKDFNKLVSQVKTRTELNVASGEVRVK